MFPKTNCEKITVYNNSGVPSTEYRHFIRQDSSASTTENAATDSKNKSTSGNYHVDNNHVNTDKINSSQTSNSKDFYAHGMDPSDTLVSNVYDTKAVQNTIGSSGTVIMDKTGDCQDLIYSNDRNYGKTGWNGHFTYESPQKKQSDDTTTVKINASEESYPMMRNTSSESTSTTNHYLDENQKARQLENNTNSRDFYGHTVDSKNTLVGNVYDTTATQNTIGTSGRIFKDNLSDSTDVLYSNDRLYGKTGWNGHFTYEAPQKKQSTDDTPSLKINASEESYPMMRNIPSESTSTTNHYVDENQKARQLQNNTNSRDFYGHTVDSKNTLVGNVYDTTATQNTIGTSGRIFKDNLSDSTDVIYSNDRNYGKTGWNGKFVYEKPNPKNGRRT